MKSSIERLCFEATVNDTYGPLRASVTTTPLERALLRRGIITLEELEREYRMAIERGEYTTYGLA